MPQRIETAWSDIPLTARPECNRGHKRTPENIRIRTKQKNGKTVRDLICRPCVNLTTQIRRAESSRASSRNQN